MRLNNSEKHNLAVSLLSDYLLKMEFEHLVFSRDKEFDIYIPSSETRIKVFCNFSNSKSLKISNDFESKNNVLYLVIKPTRKNAHGFSCVGGVKSVVDKAIKTFNTIASPKNIQIDLLKPLSVSKFVNEMQKNLTEKEVCPSDTYKLKQPTSNIRHAYVKKCRTDIKPMHIPYAAVSNCHSRV